VSCNTCGRRGGRARPRVASTRALWQRRRVEMKGDIDLVTEVDRRRELAILETSLAYRPRHRHRGDGPRAHRLAPRLVRRPARWHDELRALLPMFCPCRGARFEGEIGPARLRPLGTSCSLGEGRGSAPQRQTPAVLRASLIQSLLITGSRTTCTEARGALRPFNRLMGRRGRCAASSAALDRVRGRRRRVASGRRSQPWECTRPAHPRRGRRALDPPRRARPRLGGRHRRPRTASSTTTGTCCGGRSARAGLAANADSPITLATPAPLLRSRCSAAVHEPVLARPRSCSNCSAAYKRPRRGPLRADPQPAQRLDLLR